MLYFFALTLGLISCNEIQENPAGIPQGKTFPITNVGNIPLPDGYKRIEAAPNSFAAYARNIPLKKDNTVYLYNGTKKANQTAQYAVLNIDVGYKDLQQCADAVMRLRAEYLFANKNYSDISFSFTNGFKCDFDHFAKGYVVRFSGNNCSWAKQNDTDYSHKRLRQYLDVVYAYAGTKSLSQQMQPLPFSALEPGKILLQKREPYGHAITVMDWAYNPSTKDTIYLLSQSYMPAQDIHILRNPMNSSLSPWYSTHSVGNDIETPEWMFTKMDLKTFD